ncbi:SDR family oxidoreductase, partial [Pseudomonas sp. R2.Fl]|nr:SDR family oxidoreductase [Pseudomonas sp. R2.Fl]
VEELLAAGHTVLGLTRSDDGARRLAALGAEAHRGDLDDLDSLRRGAEKADGVIHTAFNHDFSKFAENCAADRRVIEAIGDVLTGSDRPFVVTSGIGILSAAGRLLTERDLPDYQSSATPRTATEAALDAVTTRGVRAGVVRLPPSVHDAGDHGFLPILIGLARQKGVAAYAGEGLNRWPAVHRPDAAKVYRLALENCEAGARYHAVAEEGIAFRAIAEVIGKGLGLPVTALDGEKAKEHFGWFAHFATIDVPASSQWTRGTLGWNPTGPGLIADLDSPAYFPA